MERGRKKKKRKKGGKGGRKENVRGLRKGKSSSRPHHRHQHLLKEGRSSRKRGEKRKKGRKGANYRVTRDIPVRAASPVCPHDLTAYKEKKGGKEKRKKKRKGNRKADDSGGP